MNNQQFFDQRFALIKAQENVCFKLLKFSGVLFGNDAELFDDYDLDVRSKGGSKRYFDIKIQKTLFIDQNNPMANEQDYFYLKEKTFKKYAFLAEEEDFYVAIFHAFFLNEEAELTNRMKKYGKKHFKNEIKIKRELSCLMIGVNNLRKNLELCSKKIHLHPKIKNQYLVRPNSDQGTILKINSAKIGAKINLENCWRQLSRKEQKILMRSA